MPSAILNDTYVKGKTVIITGANSGIGFETARVLAKQGCLVVLATRSREKGLETQNQIVQIISSENNLNESEQDELRQRLVPLELELTDLQSIRAFVDAFHALAPTPKLDILINNAGAVFLLAEELKEFQEGRYPLRCEKMFAANALGPIVLTELLKDDIIRSKGHIINVSSEGHTFSTEEMKKLPLRNFALMDLFAKTETANSRLTKAINVYGYTKLCNVWYTMYLHRELYQKHGVRVNCLHPGAVRTNLGASEYTWWLRPILWVISKLAFISAEQGAQTSIHLANLEDQSVSGNYFYQCRERNDLMAAEAKRDERWDELMNLCRELAAEK